MIERGDPPPMALKIAFVLRLKMLIVTANKKPAMGGG